MFTWFKRKQVSVYNAQVKQYGILIFGPKFNFLYLKTK